MPVFEIVSIAFLVAVSWLWFDSVKVRGIAVAAAARTCAAEGWQLLDETVAIARLKPARDEEGRLVLFRSYRFEYSDTGNNRRPGRIDLLGQDVLTINTGLHLVQ
jgi:hypothetical protein